MHTGQSRRGVNSVSPATKWFAGLGRRIEDSSATAALLLMALLPVLELALRTFFGAGIPGSAGYVQNLTLWVGFLGAVVASRQGRHLALTVEGVRLLPERPRRIVWGVCGAISAAVSAALFWASLQLVVAEFDAPTRIGGWLPIWVVQVVLPGAFAVITVRFIVRAGLLPERMAAVLGVAAVAAIGLLVETPPPIFVWMAVAMLIAAALAGAPIFVVLGGLALALFFAAGVPIAALPVETYRIVVSPSIPTIPLFALAGYVLAEGGAGKRLVRLFRALFGWLPGGLAVATILVCAFFSAFTGASGITIVALAGLLLPVLLQSGYPERFSTGLLTATGSIGLLFPPSLAVILYGVIAHIPITDLFVAGIVPGLLMVVSICLFGIFIGISAKVPRPSLDLKEAGAALWNAKWEVLLPVVTLGAIFGGFATLIEAASITVLYALVIEVVVHRDLHLVRDVPAVVLKCVTLIGGVFVILGVAMGLTNYLVDAEVPMRAAAWVRATIDSQIVFLLVLNVFLLAVGSLMDVFSAIVVVVPLILPIGAAFGVHPLHLAMIFLINLEVGYLTPPVGMNLFLASFRLEKPIVEVGLSVLPFLTVLLFVLLLVTYAPALTLTLGR